MDRNQHVRHRNGDRYYSSGLLSHLEPANADWTQIFGSLCLCLSTSVSDTFPRHLGDITADS
jgi:hypothetical protein